MKRMNKEILQDIKAIRQALGGSEWDAENKLSLINGEKNSSRSLLVEKSYARIVDAFIQKGSTITLRGNYKMKKWYTSRKFLLTIATGVLVALNDALGWGLSQATVTTIAGVVVGWVASEAATDIVKKQPTEATNDYTTPKDAGNV